MLARHIRGGILFVALIQSVGCSHSVYQVEMSLEEEGLHRSVTGWTERADDGGPVVQSLSEEELAALGADYDMPAHTEQDGRATFTGYFVGGIPDDIGGAGDVVRWETSLGTLTAYSERIRGSDDLARRWEERVRQIDRMCELLSGWVEANATSDDEANEVQQFINGPLRDDIKNIAMLCWVFPTQMSDDMPFEELAMRLIQYGVEHNYVSPKDVPRLMSLGHTETSERQLDTILELLDNKRGAGATALREILPPLRSVESLQESMAEYLKDTPEAEAMRREARGTEAVNIAEIPADLFIAAVSGDIIPAMLGSNEISIRFEADVAPISTNGTWDPKSRSVTWDRSIGDREGPPIGILPAQCYAVWAQPNVEFQESHFGSVVFSDRLLAELITWTEGLSSERQGEWETFINSLSETDLLREEFGRFRFEGEPDRAPDGSLLSDFPRRLLQSALEATE